MTNFEDFIIENGVAFRHVHNGAAGLLVGQLANVNGRLIVSGWFNPTDISISPVRVFPILVDETNRVG